MEWYLSTQPDTVDISNERWISFCIRMLEASCTRTMKVIIETTWHSIVQCIFVMFLYVLYIFEVLSIILYRNNIICVSIVVIAITSNLLQHLKDHFVGSCSKSRLSGGNRGVLACMSGHRKLVWNRIICNKWHTIYTRNCGIQSECGFVGETTGCEC